MNCSICLNPFENCSSTNLKCKHRFHKACIYAWLADNNSCPLCRKSVYRDTQSLSDKYFNTWYSQKIMIINDIMLYIEKNMTSIHEYFENLTYINKVFLKVIKLLLFFNIDVAYILIYITACI